MNKKILAILLATLMSATMFAGMITVTADEECIKEDDIKWVMIYQADKKELENSKGTDL